MELLIGIAAGCVISLCFSFGPAFFSLLQNSIHYGYRSTLPFVFGVNANDIVNVTLLLTVLRGVDVETILHNPWVASIGGAVLLALGVFTFTRKAHAAEGNDNGAFFVANPNPIAVYARGFFINFCNPFIWLYWLSIITIAGGTLGIEQSRLYLFFIGVLCTTLLLDVAKCKGASMLQRFLTPRVLNFFNKGVGLFLIGFSVYIVIAMLRAN